ncbi:unnamed protein product, partial [marine sediment metagenome]
ASFLPWGNMIRLLRKAKRPPDAMDIDVYHGGKKELDEFDPEMMGQGEGMLTEGPGAYTTEDPTSASFFTRMGGGQEATGHVTKFDLPDEDLPFYADFAKDFEGQTKEVQKALRQLYPDWKMPEGPIDPYRKFDWKDPVTNHPVRQLSEEVLESGMGGSELVELEELRQRLMAAGLRGTRYIDDLNVKGDVENYMTLDPSRLRKLGAEEVNVAEMIKKDPSILQRYPLLGEGVREAEYDEVFDIVKKWEDSQ